EQKVAEPLLAAGTDQQIHRRRAAEQTRLERGAIVTLAPAARSANDLVPRAVVERDAQHPLAARRVPRESLEPAGEPRRQSVGAAKHANADVVVDTGVGQI